MHRNFLLCTYKMDSKIQETLDPVNTKDIQTSVVELAGEEQSKGKVFLFPPPLNLPRGVQRFTHVSLFAFSSKHFGDSSGTSTFLLL